MPTFAASRRACCALGVAGTLLASGPAAAAAQDLSLPFQVGEALEYNVHVQRGGDVGSGRMWVEGPVVQDGHTVWLLRFDMEAGKGPIRARDRTSSWLNPVSMAITRYEKEERHPLSRSREAVTIDADSGTWQDAEGPEGVLGSYRPLDELSFLYFLRTLPIDRDTTMEFSRHFDPARNPTVVKVVGTDTLETPLGIFRTRVLEMHVRDPKRYKGTGVIRIHLYEGACRIPVRIESRMPVLGATVLSLTGWSHPPRYPGGVPC